MGIRTFFQRLFGKKDDSLHPLGNGHKNGNGNGAGGAGTKLVCVECKNAFIFKPGEQQFFKMRGLTPPKRCQNCRSKRRRRR